MTDADADLALHRAIADACLGRDAGEAMARDLGAYLRSRGVAPADVEAMLEAPPRLAVYRSLVRNGLGAVVSRMLPRTIARLDAALPGRFASDLGAFVAEAGPRTHYLRDVPAELLAWVAPRWRADAAVPAYLVDLASFELAQFEVGAAEPARAGGEPVELALDRPVALAASVRLATFAWAVHDLGETGAGEASPEARTARLLAYRDAEHEVRWLELTPLAADVVERLAAGDALGVAVVEACGRNGTTPGAVVESVARWLAEMAERGVVAGGDPTVLAPVP